MWVKFWDLHKDYLGKIVINRYFLCTFTTDYHRPVYNHRV